MAGAVVGAIAGGMLAEVVCPKINEKYQTPPYACYWGMYIFGGAIVGAIMSVLVENW